MISKKMTEAINDQINAELYSGYLYFAMSANCAAQGLKGSANWFFVQGQEEMTHAWRFFNYVHRQGQKVILAAIDKPPADFRSLKEMFEQTLKHEQVVTSRIHNLVELAVKEKDRASEIFLQWFVTEQIEEEENATDMLTNLKMVGSDGAALYMLDKELAARTFVMPPDLAGTAAAPAP